MDKPPPPARTMVCRLPFSDFAVPSDIVFADSDFPQNVS
jgi:hypothetical protein